MLIARLPFVLLAWLTLSATGSGKARAAGDPAFEGKPDCRIAPVNPSPTRVGVSWNGACKDGYANGKGVLEWYGQDDRAKRSLEATLVRGEIGGTGKLTYPGGTYLGSFKQAMPHGAGYFAYEDGTQYEGGVADGKEEGVGTRIGPDYSTYEGQWKAGKRHGRGKEVFTLGGRYEGEWRDDEYHGKGTIVYSSGRTWTGEFRAGRAADAAPLPQATGVKKGATYTTGYAPVAVHARQDRLLGTVPLDTEWEDLTPDQKNMVHSHYPALDPLDEPPYPLKGMKALYDANTEVYTRFARYQGDVLVYLTVGADGMPKAAKTYLALHPELGRFVAMALMMQRFRPARCAGKPCEMIFPARFNFSLEE